MSEDIGDLGALEPELSGSTRDTRYLGRIVGELQQKQLEQEKTMKAQEEKLKKQDAKIQESFMMMENTMRIAEAAMLIASGSPMGIFIGIPMLAMGAVSSATIASELG